MTISTHSCGLQSVIVLNSVCQQLIFAQQRLQDRNIPFYLGALSYLRISCAALRTYQKLELHSPSGFVSKTPYMTLLNQLAGRHQEWWKLCKVDDLGYLVSSDRHINALLPPLNTFVAQILEVPQAA